MGKVGEKVSFREPSKVNIRWRVTLPGDANGGSLTNYFLLRFQEATQPEIVHFCLFGQLDFLFLQSNRLAPRSGSWWPPGIRTGDLFRHGFSFELYF